MIFSLHRFSSENRGSSAREPLSGLLLFALLTAAATLIRGADLSSGPVLIPALWGLGAVLPLRPGEGDLLAFGVKGPEMMRNLRYFLLSSMVVFPLYALAFRLYAQWGFPVPARISLERVLTPGWFFYNFAAVAFFEELFFRGFLQGRFEIFSRERFLKPGTVFWTPILASAFLFALAHAAVFLDPREMVVFFPGLLFGWLRARTGSLLAPILSHGTANLVSMLLLGWVS